MDVAAAAAAGGDIILLLTMIVFGYQAREMAQQSRAGAAATRASVYQSIAQQMQEIDKLFVVHPHLRPFIYENKPTPREEPTRTQVLALSELLVDFFDNFVAQSGQIPSHLYEPWERYARSVMETSPSMCVFWSQNREWYSELLHEMLDPALAISSQAIQTESAEEWAATGGAGAAPSVSQQGHDQQSRTNLLMSRN